MTSKNRSAAGYNLRRASSLILLVSLVFVIQLVSIALAAGLSYLLMRMGILSPLSDSSFPTILIFLLLVSLLLGTLLAVFGVERFLRPMRRLNEASKQVGAGDFNVHVAPDGPQEFSLLAESFNDMVKKLSGIETLRNDFVSNISHEYKTPIVSIRGFARRLKKNNLTKEQRDEYLDIIIAEADRLTQLSGNVLLLSKLENTDKLTDVAEFSLDEQLRRVILLLDQQMEKKKLHVDIELESCTITSSQELYEQVWINLINNAVKFTPEGGHIAVTLSCTPNQAIVTVRDSGIGMVPEVAEHIFDKFYQGDGSRSTEGNGLGLSLVRKITELCGSSVEVQSEPGKGSVVTVVIPR